MRTTVALAAAAFLLACDSGSSSTPAYPDSREPNETLATAATIPVGEPISASVANGSDRDWYAFTVPAGGATVRFQTFDASGTACATTDANPIDTCVDVSATTGLGWPTGSSDDSAIIDGARTRCEDFTVALPGGTSYVDVMGFPATAAFAYTLMVTIP